MSFTPRFPPPPPYSLLPGETERTLSADAAPPPPPYRPLPRAVTSHTAHKMSAEQVVIWLHSEPVFAPREYENVLDILLWHEMVQTGLDEILATAPGPESSFWEAVLVEVESERELSFCSRKYAVPNDARVREPVLHYLSKDLPLWDVISKSPSHSRCIAANFSGDLGILKRRILGVLADHVPKMARAQRRVRANDNACEGAL
ncbi:hypothetical protein HOY82DRAFT_589544 [Tuber indicum]|nr:hypothetical protein HOY82DRAFT_589544 [Tuber indicum]